jgi:hypothetical protein
MPNADRDRKYFLEGELHCSLNPLRKGGENHGLEIVLLFFAIDPKKIPGSSFFKVVQSESESRSWQVPKAGNLDTAPEWT